MRRLTVTATFAALLVCATGCQDPYQGNPAGPKVGIAGDSITFNSKTAIYAELDPDHYVSIAATVGERSDQTVGTPPGQFTGDVDSVAQTNPAIAVLELGTNDIGVYPTERTLDDLAADRAKFTGCVITVNLSTHATDAFAPAAADPTAWNTAAAAINAGLPTDHLVDWDAETGVHPEDLNPDGIHPSPAGQARYAQLIHAAADTCP